MHRTLRSELRPAATLHRHRTARIQRVQDHRVHTGVPRRAGPQARIREYPVDHFDTYQGPWQRQAVTDQLEFLTAVSR
ncbi:hypothetical protein [Nocardia sp. NPDC046763]|uniref:hypothetical protein n=1 Tax=Nocardia sp. NPDC046763 TaxID=3155256 RepID=UPI0033E9A44C